MKIDSKQLLGLLGIGVIVYALSNRKPKPQFVPQQTPLPPQPQPNTGAWQQWVNLIIDTFGNVAELWSPGGPFYKNRDVWNYVPPPGDLDASHYV